MSLLLGLALRWLVLSLAVAAAAWLLPGVRVQDADGVATVVVMAGVLGLLNAVVRPVLVFLSCGCIVLTLGAFLLVINAVIFWLASWISEEWLGAAFHVDSFLWALAGSIITGIVSFVLELLFGVDIDVRIRD